MRSEREEGEEEGKKRSEEEREVNKKGRNNKKKKRFSKSKRRDFRNRVTRTSQVLAVSVPTKKSGSSNTAK